MYPMNPHTEPEKVLGDYLCRRQEGLVTLSEKVAVDPYGI